ncbi:MAG: glycosyltransferase family 4 protein [Solirubrobacterales bacterium]|nr:glycosyltransferase family 4 protein [Solirubrobacterales bacterium]
MLAEWLVDHLREHGHRTELVYLPYRWHPPHKLLEHAVAARLTRISEVDRVIALKFPSWYLPHDNKVFWVLHQFRAAYDLWGSGFQLLPDTPEGQYIRRAIVEADNRVLREARRLYAISQVTARRVRAFNGVEPTVLYPPLGNEQAYRCGAQGNYVFFPSRINSVKRQGLAIEAMRFVSSDIRLVIAGDADFRGNDFELVSRMLTDRKLRDRVELLTGWLPERRKLDLFAHCLGVLFPPYDEDYGYVTLEGFRACKPVITCTDSGGPLELVEHGISGFVADPDPRSIAEAIDQLAADRRHAARMGRNGRERIRTLGIDWDHVVEELTT